MRRIEVFAIESATEDKEKGSISLNGTSLYVIKKGEKAYSTSDNESQSLVIESILFDGKEVNEISIFQQCTLVFKRILTYKIQELDLYLFGQAAQEYEPTITYAQARQLAEELAYENLNHFVPNNNSQLLSHRFEEAECCWFFFTNEDIIPTLPEEAWFSKSYSSYAISKKGEARSIYNYTNEKEKLKKYVHVLSNYFKLNRL
ncbi:hypothetical protein [Paenibacillus rigui]|uniref:Uncharacterized protein n=1 Tax=Paenibacillus rigui TaxID=554312 RepID=A0A229UGC3_9BACL|nr:hypothetical protein [Paenibacillus rigui]OXM82457.1 hypothetical protein CF651_30900 [Paenibacillus rigui]